MGGATYYRFSWDGSYFDGLDGRERFVRALEQDASVYGPARKDDNLVNLSADDMKQDYEWYSPSYRHARTWANLYKSVDDDLFIEYPTDQASRSRRDDLLRRLRQVPITWQTLAPNLREMPMISTQNLGFDINTKFVNGLDGLERYVRLLATDLDILRRGGDAKWNIEHENQTYYSPSLSRTWADLLTDSESG